MHGEFRTASNAPVYVEGDDYLAIDRTSIAKIVLVDDFGNVVQEVTPTGTEIPANAIYRRRTTLSTTASAHVAFIYGFPTTPSDPVYIYDDGIVTQVILDDSSALLRSVVPKTGEFTSPDIGGNALFTQAEINELNTRSFDGPFKTNGYGPIPGIPSTGFRGTWDEIVDLANAFTAGTWSGPAFLTNGRVAFNEDNDPTTQANNAVRQRARQMVAGAFRDMVRGTTTHRADITTHMVNQAQVAKLQWDSTYWGNWNTANTLFTAYNGIDADSRPTIGYGNWLSMYMETLIMYGVDHMTTTQLDTVMDWLITGTEMLAGMSRRDLETRFVSWHGNDYTSAADWGNNPETGYFGSKTIANINKFYNNRIANNFRCMMMLVSLCEQIGYSLSGRKYSLATYKTYAKKWVKEWITFSVYPEGFFGEFERFSDTDVMRGLSYAGTTIAQSLTIAALLARAGDTELLDFSTTAGVHNWAYEPSRETNSDNTAGPITASGDPEMVGLGRSLLFASRSYLRYAYGFYNRYGTIQAARVDNDNYKLKWANPVDPGEFLGTEALWFADLNRYWEDPIISSVIDRTATGMPPYPPEYEQGFRLSGWHGDGHIYPSVLLMWHQLAANPYAGL